MQFFSCFKEHSVHVDNEYDIQYIYPGKEFTVKDFFNAGFLLTSSELKKKLGWLGQTVSPRAWLNFKVVSFLNLKIGVELEISFKIFVDKNILFFIY